MHGSVGNPQMPSASSAAVDETTTGAGQVSAAPSRGNPAAASFARSKAIHIRSFVEEVENPFRIGLVIENYEQAKDPLISAIASPLSRCRVSALVVLHNDRMLNSWHDSFNEPNSSKTEDGTDHEEALLQRHERALDWLRQYRVTDLEDVAVEYGETGLQKILKSPKVDALYVIVPYEKGQHEYGMQALAANKHLLLKDHVSTSLEYFKQELELAESHNKFVQFSTMFVQHYRVQTFLDCVLRQEQFGKIESIDAKLFIAYKDAAKVGASLPLSQGQGCIKHVGRFCVLLSILMFSRSGSRPISAKVKNAELSNEGTPMSARCVVNFSQNRSLQFDVCYFQGPTRQVLDVRAHDHYATMNDFVIPHPEGLSTYRVYQKAMNPVTGKLEVESGEAMDVPSGVKEDVLMWKRFRELCRSVDMDGWAHAKQGQVQELTQVSLMTKRVLMALSDSLARDYCEVPVEMGEDGRI